LDHEVRYEAMEERAIVIARGAKGKEVLAAGKFDMFQAGRGEEGRSPLQSWAHFRRRLQS
jgi:hypothetical protein